jgi:diadenosine tetraphosphatase ApaH/serine/threonine PP2A family protein phosphatase
MQDASGNLYYEDDPLIRIKPGMKYIVNVGSVGQPRDNDWRAAYCIYDTEKKCVQLKRVKYNAQGAMRKILDSGLPHFLGERLLTGN